MPIDSRMDDPNEDEDLISPNERRPMRLLDSLRQHDAEAARQAMYSHLSHVEQRLLEDLDAHEVKTLQIEIH